MRNLLIISALLCITTGCNRNKQSSPTSTSYYPGSKTSRYIETFSTPKHDSVSVFYENGNLYKTGKVDKSRSKFGNWEHRTKDGILREIREFFIVNGESKLNRVTFLNTKGDTIPIKTKDIVYDQKEFIGDTTKIWFTIYDKVQIWKDTISINEPLGGVAYCNTPQLRGLESEIRVFVTSEDIFTIDNFPEDAVLRETTWKNLKYDTITQKSFPHIPSQKYGYVALFGLVFEKPGKKWIRGYVEEYARPPYSITDSTEVFLNQYLDADSIVSKRYFQKEVFVTNN